MDPIEKKPLFHVAPGTQAYSLATAGCPFHCVFCQNWEIAQGPRLGSGRRPARLPPDRAVAEALELGARSIAYTYVEPTVFLEYALAIARPARAAGLLNLFITDGYATPEAIGLLATVLDAANVDLKGFNDAFYRRRCGARLDHVLEALEGYRRAGVWLEVTTLVIPGENDDPAELRELTAWLVDAPRAPRPRGTSAASSRRSACWTVRRRRWPRSVAPPRSAARPACATSTSATRPSWPWRTRAASVATRCSLARRGYHLVRHLADDGTCPTLRAPPGRPRARGWARLRDRSHADERRRSAPPAAPVAALRPSPAASTRPTPASWLSSSTACWTPVRTVGRGRRGRAGLAGILVPHAGLAYSGPSRPSRGGSPASVLPARRDLGRPAPSHHHRHARHEPRRRVARRRRGLGRGRLAEPRSATSRSTRTSPRRSSALGPPFAVDRDAHRSEHSLEVQLPFVARALPGARIVPLAIGDRHGRAAPSTRGRSSGRPARGATRRGGARSAWRSARTWRTTRRRRSRPGSPRSSRRPSSRWSRRGWPAGRRTSSRSGLPGVVCGMCGIEPTVVGLAALRAMGVERGVRLAAATSADAGGPGGPAPSGTSRPPFSR